MHDGVWAVLIGSLVGLGDGVIGQVPLVDKAEGVHTIYRGGVLIGGLAASLMDAPTAVSVSLISSSTALLASRVPAAITSRSAAQMG